MSTDGVDALHQPDIFERSRWLIDEMVVSGVALRDTIARLQVAQATRNGFLMARSTREIMRHLTQLSTMNAALDHQARSETETV